MLRNIIVIMTLIVLSFSLEACGRKSAPVAPDDVEKTYPRTYPAPTKFPGQ